MNRIHVKCLNTVCTRQEPQGRIPTLPSNSTIWKICYEQIKKNTRGWGGKKTPPSQYCQQLPSFYPYGHLIKPKEINKLHRNMVIWCQFVWRSSSFGFQDFFLLRGNFYVNPKLRSEGLCCCHLMVRLLLPFPCHWPLPYGGEKLILHNKG